ncbi:heterokaryon incompatibility protein-domain-containing protein [Immersiella caudata]|uniref:Heterokaryon incompatibility protein-domain-containing protein n=1 Tax=Immersiella caudata TaxID=314043 RepID=A0AA39WSK0_9PEZI|nr:heterokaryon incompatibility protein-domain-containing protein [Immersiella caudata]
MAFARRFGGLQMTAGTLTHPPLSASPPPSPGPESSPIDRVHKYRRLQDDEIRLLILNPGSEDEPISCFLEHSHISKTKPYHALSYAWGSALEPRTILLDGCPTEVSGNLEAFLRSRRREHECPVLWVDAVCINQADMDEKRAQIQLMKRVYEGSDLVLVWLGEAIDGTARTLDWMEDLFHDFWLPRLTSLNRSVSASLGSITDRDARRILFEVIGDEGDPLGDRELQGMEHIFSNPWWSRIWVYQEATAPTKRATRVLIGKYEIPFQTILAVGEILRHLSSHGHGSFFSQNPGLANNTPVVVMQIYRELRAQYIETGTSRFLRLADLLPSLRSFDATNPRDKLYALIPTSLDGAELLHVAYDRPVEEAYAQIAWTLIQKHRSLDILGHCCRGEGNSLLKLPSWVPDWTAKGTAMHFFKRGISPDWRSTTLATDQEIPIAEGDRVPIGKLYSASGDSLPEISLDDSGTRLSCKGYIFDAVRHVTPTAGTTESRHDVVEEWMTWLDLTLSAMAGCQLPYSNIKTAFSHTMVADCERVAVDVGMRDCSLGLGAKREGRMTGLHPATFRRKLFLTGRGYLGLTDAGVMPGDEVVVLMGGQCPFVLRRQREYYELVGEAYVHGIMDGDDEQQRGGAVGSGETRKFEIR